MTDLFDVSDQQGRNELSYSSDSDPESNLNLLELALRLRWSSVLSRARTHPHELIQQDQDGLNVLHWACCNHASISIHVFETLLGSTEEDRSDRLLEQEISSRVSLRRDLVRKALTSVDYHNGMTPLLCLCADGEAPVNKFGLLLDACPESLEVSDRDGWTALHYLCHQCQHTHHRENHYPQYRPTSGPILQKTQLVLEKVASMRNTTMDDSHGLSIINKEDVFGKTALDVLCCQMLVEDLIRRGTTTNLLQRRAQTHYDLQDASLPILANSTPPLRWTLACALLEADDSIGIPFDVDTKQLHDEDPTAPGHREPPFRMNVLQKMIVKQMPACLVGYTCVRHPEYVLNRQPTIISSSTTQQHSGGDTTLHLAIQCQAYELGCLLIKHSPILVHCVNAAGETPLHMATRKCCSMNVLLLDLFESTAMAVISPNHTLDALVGEQDPDKEDPKLPVSIDAVSNHTLPSSFQSSLTLQDNLYPNLLGLLSWHPGIVFAILKTRPGLVKNVPCNE